MTHNQRLAITRMYVTERKSPVYIAHVLSMSLEAVRSLTDNLVRDPTPHSRSANERKRKESHA